MGRSVVVVVVGALVVLVVRVVVGASVVLVVDVVSKALVVVSGWKFSNVSTLVVTRTVSVVEVEVLGAVSVVSSASLVGLNAVDKTCGSSVEKICI